MFGFNPDKYYSLLWDSNLWARVGETEKAEACKAEADAMMRDYIHKLDEQAGIIRPAN